MESWLDPEIGMHFYVCNSNRRYTQKLNIIRPFDSPGGRFSVSTTIVCIPIGSSGFYP